MLTSSEPFEYLFLNHRRKTSLWSVWPIKKTEEMIPVINNMHTSMGMSRLTLIYSL